jgi:hypothetical protein
MPSICKEVYIYKGCYLYLDFANRTLSQNGHPVCVVASHETVLAP